VKKRMKFISLLVLSLVLLASTTASATIVNITPDNFIGYAYIAGGTAELVNTLSAPGTASDLSLKMVWPTTSYDSGISITGLGGPTINGISGFSYWVYAASNKNPHLMMYLDTDGDGSWDTLVKDKRYNGIGGIDRGNTWLELDSSDTLGPLSFSIKKGTAGSTSWAGTWADFQAKYGTAVVKEVRICHVGYITDFPTTAHLDDFSFGSTQYVFSNVPEPATVSILGLGSIVLLRRKKH
jgi:hypothetical protein